MSLPANNGTVTVWKPLPGSQVDAMACPANHILYEGTRGPGKTDWQLMRFRRLVGVGYGAFWRGVIFDRKYKNLEDIISKSKRWFPAFKDGARFIGSGELKWVWPTGEELHFRHMNRLADYWNYHGQEYPYIGWNELTKYPTSELYDMMMSCNRSSFRPEDYPLLMPDPIDGEGLMEVLLPEMPLEVTSTTNPFGPGHNWVKGRFIEDDDGVEIPAGKIIRNTKEVFNPKTQQREMVTKTQARIFGIYKENIYLSPEAILELESITDEAKREAWLYGNWDIIAGGAFDDVWDRAVHIVPRFEVPAAWRIDRAMDWGTTAPFSVGWWAKANGEEVTITYPDGHKRRFCPAAGSLIRCHEWYGTKKIGTNQGLKQSARSVAEGIKDIEEGLRTLGWINDEVWPGPADNSIFPGGAEIEDHESVSSLMRREGVTWEKSDKSPGSRVNGLQLMRDAMLNSKTGDRPGIYIMDHCSAFLKTVPILPRDEEKLDDVDTTAEDHVYDEARYRLLASAADFAHDMKLKFY